MKSLVTVALLLVSITSFAQDIFILKKSMNPKNVLHFKANVENGKLKAAPVSAYWIMGEEDGHVEGLSSSEKPYFSPKVSYLKDSEADFTFGAVEKMGAKLGDKTIRVRLENGKPKAYLTINNQEILIVNIYVEANLFMQPKYMIISGKKPDGSTLNHRIDA